MFTYTLFCQDFRLRVDKVACATKDRQFTLSDKENRFLYWGCCCNVHDRTQVLCKCARKPGSAYVSEQYTARDLLNEWKQRPLCE